MVCNSEKKTNAMPSSKRQKAVVPGRRASVAEDIVTEVLLRLPIKTVVRFRAVCRSWATLLSSEEFCRLHRAITKAAGVPLKLMYFSPTQRFDATAAYSCSLSPGPRDNQLLFTLDYAHGSWVEVLTPAPCHGLNLLYDALAKAYYICNAATWAVVRLPPSGDAAAHRISTGLGFDARTREYKVVRLIDGMRLSHDQDTIRCEVYTPGGIHGDCWRPAARGLPFGLRRYAISAVYNAEDKRSGKKIVITTCKHKVHEKFEKKVHTYDLSTEDLYTILSVTETSKSTYGSLPYNPPASGFSLFEDCLAPLHKTDEELDLSFAPVKAVKEILFRLPVKSVIQSKLICKQWLRLINSESFIQSYFEHKNIGRRPKLMLVGKGFNILGRSINGGDK
ncbi:hypothetical protein ACQ4PT_071055 [Festuca glaucescens]